MTIINRRGNRRCNSTPPSSLPPLLSVSLIFWCTVCYCFCCTTLILARDGYCCCASLILKEQALRDRRYRRYCARTCRGRRSSWACRLAIFGIRTGNAQGVGHVAGIAAPTSARRRSLYQLRRLHRAFIGRARTDALCYVSTND